MGRKWRGRARAAKRARKTTRWENGGARDERKEWREGLQMIQPRRGVRSAISFETFMRNILPAVVPQLQRLKNCTTRGRDRLLISMAFSSGLSRKTRMFRPHNRIFLWESRAEKERKERRRMVESRKEREAWPEGKEVGEKRGNKNKTKPGGFHGLLTAERNSKRGYTRPLCYQTNYFNEVTGQRQFPNQVGGSLDQSVFRQILARSSTRNVAALHRQVTRYT